MLAFVRAAPDYIELPEDVAQPKRGDFTQWASLIADWAVPGPHLKDIRAHLKQVSNSAWQLANWLTHTSNALPIDAELTMDATHHVLEIFSTAVIRKESDRPERCPQCASVQMHRELVRRFLQRQPLAQPQDAMGTHARPWMRMKDAHVPQRPTLSLGQH